MIFHLPVLQVVLPLLCAPLCVLFRTPRVAALIYFIAAASAFACAVGLNIQTLDGIVLHYQLGGWSPPAGIEYVIDGANAPLLLLVSLIALLVSVYAPRSIASELEPARVGLFFACMCLCLAGLLGIAATGDAFNVFVFLEISSLASYALIALGARRRALLAAFQYLVLGTIGGTFLLIGIGLVYAITGTLNMADLAQRVSELGENRALIGAIAFVTIGMAIKAAVFPLHAWQPGAYSESPSAVGVFLSATGSKIALYTLCRFLFTIFGASVAFQVLPLTQIGLLVGCVGMIAGSLMACLQTDFKRVLAWSSIGQVGYIVAGISLATSEGLTAAYLHILNHALIKAALFAAAGVVMLRLGGTDLQSIAGLGRLMPWTFAMIVVAGLGLIGVPLSAGFVSKWALATALIDSGQWLVLAAVLFSSLLALVYVGRIVEAAWFREPQAGRTPAAVPRAMTAVTALLAIATIYFGIDTRLPLALAQGASAALLGVGP